MDRRSFLGTAGALGLAAGSGCLEPFPYIDSSLQLLWVSIENNTEARRTIDIRVDRGGETVHESSHTLEPGGWTPIECTWDGSEGRYTVAGRLSGGAWIENGVAAEFERLPDCAVATLRCFERTDAPPGFDLFARAECDTTDSPCG